MRNKLEEEFELFAKTINKADFNKTLKEL